MRLIDADNIHIDSSPDTSIEFDAGIVYVLKMIDKIPTLDVAPVVHGHWVLEREPDGKPYCLHCSNCDDDFRRIDIRSYYDYCPNCGAKMDEEERNNQYE